MNDYLVYESYFDGSIPKPLFLTKTGNKPVGGIFLVGKGPSVAI